MNWNTYTTLFEEILEGSFTQAPYDKEAYLQYVQLNNSRQNRWIKRGALLPELVAHLEQLDQPQQWILITEPWCGDASHINPFIYQLSQESDQISFDIMLRDSDGSIIQDYLTNGGMSIPILVVRDENGKDLFSWGPRPEPAQELYLNLKDDESKTMDEKKIALQSWYNKDKGATLQRELLGLFQSVTP